MNKLKKMLKQKLRKWRRESREKKLTLKRQRPEERKLLLMPLSKKRNKPKLREKLSDRRMPSKLNNTRR